MVVKVRDLPADQEDTIAHRIKLAREEAGLSRSKLGEATGISMRTIEKYEYGTSEPPISRLAKIAEVLEVDTQWLIDGEDTSPEPKPPMEPTPLFTAFDVVVSMLEELDDMRELGMEKTPRKTLAAIEVVRTALKAVEPTDLLELAMARGVYQPECANAAEIDERFRADPMDGQSACLEIEERIIDTAILGADLFALDRDNLVEALNELADENDRLDAPLFGWGRHEEFVPRVRPELRRVALVGNGPDFGDPTAFPRRELEPEGTHA